MTGRLLQHHGNEEKRVSWKNLKDCEKKAIAGPQKRSSILGWGVLFHGTVRVTWLPALCSACGSHLVQKVWTKPRLSFCRKALTGTAVAPLVPLLDDLDKI